MTFEIFLFISLIANSVVVGLFIKDMSDRINDLEHEIRRLHE